MEETGRSGCEFTAHAHESCVSVAIVQKAEEFRLRHLPYFCAAHGWRVKKLENNIINVVSIIIIFPRTVRCRSLWNVRDPARAPRSLMPRQARTNATET